MAESITDVDSEMKCDIRKRRITTDHQKVEANSGSITDGKDAVEMECSVCLQSCIHPARLPCGHIFCFLCAKGVMNQSRRCAMCRRLIPPDFFDRPELLPLPQPQPLLDGYQWFYEGRNGWWQYDERTSRELEAAYAQGSRTCELLIAGYLYVADFDAMLQTRRHEPARRRRIKRDLASTPKKGIAGLWQQLSKLSVVETETEVVTDLEAHVEALAVTAPDDSDCI